MSYLTRMLVVAALLFTISPACAEEAVSPLVSKAIDAIGRTGLEHLTTMMVRGTGTFWEPDENFQAGGAPLHVADVKYEIRRNFTTDAARLDWERDYLVVPWPRLNKYSEVIVGGIGFAEGNDGGARTAGVRSNAPQRPMTGNRLAATTRELQRSAPTLLRDMALRASSVSPHHDIVVGGKALPAVVYQGELASFIVAFDVDTGLPERIRTMDFDPLHGDLAYDLVLSDWRPVGEIKYPFRQHYEMAGVKLMEFQVVDAAFNPSLDETLFAVPESIRASAATTAKTAKANVPYLWILRRQMIGSYNDVENLTHDPNTTTLQLVERAPGISQVQGSIHHTLIVEMSTYLIVIDAPYMDGYSRWVIEQAKVKYPGKPIRYLILTHHHIDHVAGFRSYLAAGAALVVGSGTRDFWEKIIASSDHLGADSPKTLLRPDIVSAANGHVITDGIRRVELYDLPSEHSHGMLLAYIPDAKLGYQTDIWTGPGVDPLGARAMPRQLALIKAVKDNHLDVEHVLGGHGRVGLYADLLRSAEGPVSPQDAVVVANRTNRHVAFNASPNGSYWIPFELEAGAEAPLFNTSAVNVVTGRLSEGRRVERTEKVEKGKRYQLVVDRECDCLNVKPLEP